MMKKKTKEEFVDFTMIIYLTREYAYLNSSHKCMHGRYILKMSTIYYDLLQIETARIYSLLKDIGNVFQV